MVLCRSTAYPDAPPEEGDRMRQWELFGITDSQPTWTPPSSDESGTAESIPRSMPATDEGDQEELVAT